MNFRSLIFACVLFISISVFSQEIEEDSLKYKISSSLTNIYKETLLRPGRVTVDSITVNTRRKTIEFHTNLALSYLPMRESTVRLVYDSVRYHLPHKQKKYLLSVFSDGEEISHLIPNFHRNKQPDKNRIISHKVKTPL